MIEKYTNNAEIKYNGPKNAEGGGGRKGMVDCPRRQITSLKSPRHWRQHHDMIMKLTRLSPDAGSMLGQRRRRWANIELLGQCLVAAEI